MRKIRKSAVVAIASLALVSATGAPVATAATAWADINYRTDPLGGDNVWYVGNKLNDRISSFKTYGKRTTFYTDYGYTGASFTADYDQPNIKYTSDAEHYNFDNKISSWRLR